MNARRVAWLRRPIRTARGLRAARAAQLEPLPEMTVLQMEAFVRNHFMERTYGPGGF